jgi:hypothetical protein
MTNVYAISNDVKERASKTLKTTDLNEIYTN